MEEGEREGGVTVTKVKISQNELIPVRISLPAVCHGGH